MIVIAVTLKLTIDLIAQRFIFRHAPLATVDQNSGLEIFAQVLIDGIWAGLLFLLVEGKYRIPFWDAIRWKWEKANWGMIAIGAVTFIVLQSLGNLLPMPKETPFDRLFKNARDAYFLAIMAVTIGPAVEELFFRGFLYPVLARRWGIAWGVFFSALPFALLHLPQYGYAWGIILVVFGVGVVCGIVRAVTGSVAASFLVHVGFNGIQMLIAMLFTHGFTRAPKGLLLCWPK
jgi:membrane protease YdiL (CAAX protease family)